MRFQIILLLVTFVTLSQQQRQGGRWMPRASKETLTKLDGEIRNVLKAKHEFIGGFVRLAFHDCIGKGRCDGCINLHNEDNKGLEVYIPTLEKIYQGYKRRITRADLFACLLYTSPSPRDS